MTTVDKAPQQQQEQNPSANKTKAIHGKLLMGARQGYVPDLEKYTGGITLDQIKDIKDSKLGYNLLHRAADDKQPLAVKSLVTKYPELVLEQSEGMKYTALQLAAYRGNTASMKVLLDDAMTKKLGKKALGKRDNWGSIPLHTAVWCNHPAAIKLLLEAWPGSVNETDAKGNTPLHKSLQEDNVMCTKVLVAFGANAEAKNEAGHTPVEHAATSLLIDVQDNNSVKFLRAAGNPETWSTSATCKEFLKRLEQKALRVEELAWQLAEAGEDQ